MHTFSNLNRSKMIAAMRSKQLDLLVIGGGITGAGIALDAVSRGMNVALVEKNDFASGTSSKSTKLIHGGLRYLKQFDFWLVKEVGTERAILHRLAPHLVIPEKMLLPIIENGSYGSWLTSIGLKIYDLLASVEDDDRRKMLSKEKTLEKEPLLPEDILDGSGYYAEYRTDDARLTIEVLKTAADRGVTALNYCKVDKLTFIEGRVSGATVTDQLSTSKDLSGKESFDIQARYVVNATGPWVDELRQQQEKHPSEQVEFVKKSLQPTKGVHLVFPHEKLPLQQAVYFDVPDGRMIFGIPRGKCTYVGTTDTRYLGDLDNIEVELVDALYLINAVNNMFPEIELDLGDVESSWVGLRPLIGEEGKSPGELSRKDEIFEADNGLISIAGGKLTGYRKMAERIVDLVADRLKQVEELDFRPVQTENIPLTKRPFPNFKAVKGYTQEVYKQLESHGFDRTDVKSLVHRYGRQLDQILERFQDETHEDPKIRMAKAELWYGLNYEMVTTALDFFDRRTGRLYFENPEIENLRDPLLNQMAETLNWSEERTRLELEMLNKAQLAAMNFD